ncbi:ABC transporter I family member 10-like protein [Tanacetum coccineum]
MLGLVRLRRTPSACLCLRAYPSIDPGPDGLDPTRKKTSLMLSERPLGASLSTRLVQTPGGGQKQRVAIAGALVKECKVLLLDELTTFLDESDQLGVIKAVKNTLSSSEDVTALWVTHRLEELEYADGVVYMEDGRVVMHGEASTIINSIEARKATYTNTITLYTMEQMFDRKFDLGSHFGPAQVNTASSRANNIMMLEVNAGNSRHNEKRPLEISSPVKEARKHPENNGSNTSVFINQGAIAWNENRRKWVGDQSQRSRARTPEDPVISWSTTYEDLLSNNDRFSEPIPLPEMVDFLVDIWLDEGLYD